MMYPVLQDVVVTRILNDTNTTVAVINVIDPYTVIILAIISIIATIVGFAYRGAIVSLIAFVLCIITGVIYANGFMYYDSSSNVLILYQSIPLAFLYITLAIVNIIAFMYKMLAIPVRREAL